MMWYGAGGWWMAIWMVVFWVGVVLLVIWAVRALSGGGPGRADTGPDRAIRILEERFARGEIDRDEFEQRRSALEGR